MKSYVYLIIGGGMTADAAVRGIRELDSDGSIGMISSEADMPYSRPPLTKGMWKGRPLEKIWRGTDKFNVDFHLGRTVTRMDPKARQVQDEQGETYGYEKLLLATGGTPRRLPFGGNDIIYYRTLNDYKHLRELTDEKNRFLVIGAGFIGSELAAALRMNDKQVFMVYRGENIGETAYPQDLSKYITDYFKNKGVNMMPKDEVIALEKTGKGYKVQTKSGTTLEVDGVIAGLGIEPNVELAQMIGLKVDDGIVVNDHLLTSAADVYAAGDVARFPHPALNKPMRVEHEDNSLKMGKQAGRNMAGANEAYTYTPMFYSDLFELGYEAVGELKSDLQIVEDWKVPNEKGVVYYLKDKRVNGVLIWGTFGLVPKAVALMQEPGPFNGEELQRRITD